MPDYIRAINIYREDMDEENVDMAYKRYRKYYDLINDYLFMINLVN